MTLRGPSMVSATALDRELDRWWFCRHELERPTGQEVPSGDWQLHGGVQQQGKSHRLRTPGFHRHALQVEVIQLNEESGKFVSRGVFDHPYPTTKIMWLPDKTGRSASPCSVLRTGHLARSLVVRGRLPGAARRICLRQPATI